MSEERRRRRLRDYPVLPTILTAGNLASGVTAILCAMSAHGEAGLLFHGGVLIFAAMVFDMFDGKVARLTGTDSEFGAELDSIADIVSFGVAPAMLLHRIVLGGPPDLVLGEGERWIWFLSVFFVVMAAIRLARYNVEHDDQAQRFFQGLPSPGAAAALSAWAMLYSWFTTSQLRWDRSFLATEWGMRLETFEYGARWIMMVLALAMALLMVSRLPFIHVGNVLLSGRLSLGRLIALFLLIGLLIIQPLYLLVVLTTLYIVVGCVVALFAQHREHDGGRAST
ncbi:MAG: CDP-alcohol phosphatidyltransferase family protein [Planctomycetota bacterium]